ncbi:extracellular catalytic domain type 1 short-chain-length polyhydroxyalkanoate depolymerase [Sorangium sp. So ce1000]|uniref:extracellular catalytic domain type 1 short-chain-length polyhydroxyalkanoate depolymerase n=1 Tax=Sorangium sp. So ce1000 TaxID=3133325 RepID=UPI003F5E50EA
MRRFQNRVFVVASFSLGLFAAMPVYAASVTAVSRATWGASGVPDYVNMNIYVPDKLAENPPIVVACHSCSTPVSGFFTSISGIKAGADKNGFIIILPEATGRNCWDVGTTKSLTHDGGGDTQAVAQMVKYALTKYKADPKRVYVMGGSSGAMMTQAMLAVYPDIFRAGAARAGVAAGCWADGFDPGQQWSNNCAGGRTSKTAQQWGDQVRGMYPGFTGHRPRLQIFHGTSDATINYKNQAEAIKEWTNVLELSETPTSTDTFTGSATTYDRQFWKNECGQSVFEAWSGRNGAHSMPYEADAILAFFGLDKAGGADPETDCSDSAGSGGTEGSGGGAGGAESGSGAGPAAGSGGASGEGGSASGNASVGSGEQSSGNGSGATTGGSTPGGTTGGIGSGSGAGSGAGSGGGSGQGSGEDSGSASESGGCAVAIGGAKPKSAYAAVVAMGLALLAFRRRNRNARS